VPRCPIAGDADDSKRSNLDAANQTASAYYDQSRRTLTSSAASELLLLQQLLTSDAFVTRKYLFVNRLVRFIHRSVTVSEFNRRNSNDITPSAIVDHWGSWEN